MSLDVRFPPLDPQCFPTALSKAGVVHHCLWWCASERPLGVSGPPYPDFAKSKEHSLRLRVSVSLFITTFISSHHNAAVATCIGQLSAIGTHRASCVAIAKAPCKVEEISRRPSHLRSASPSVSHRSQVWRSKSPAKSMGNLARASSPAQASA